MKTILAIVSLVFLTVMYSCSGNSGQKNQNTSADDTYHPESATTTVDTASHPELNDSTENKRGIGQFTHVDLGAHLDQQMADAGKSIYDLKCYSCHHLDETKLVGPGWKGVTTRRTPEWIMNFATNTDEMLNKDPQAQALLEICLIRMPNQNLSPEDARKVLEFMRENDGVK